MAAPTMARGSYRRWYGPNADKDRNDLADYGIVIKDLDFYLATDTSKLYIRYNGNWIALN